MINPSNRDILRDMMDFVEEELEYVDDQSMNPNLSTESQAKLEKDYRALTAVDYVLKNHMKALRNPELLKTSLFIYDWEEDDTIGAVQVRITDSQAEILWLGSYYSSGKTLLKTAIEQARAKGAKKIKVTSKWESEEYYRKQGFTVTDKRSTNPLSGVGSDLSKDITEKSDENSVLLEYNRQVTKRKFGKSLAGAIRKDKYYVDILRDYYDGFQDSDEYLVDTFLEFLESELGYPKYIPWAIIRYIRGEYRYEDVVFNFSQLIHHFETIKPYLKRMGKSTDIMQYSFKDVEDLYYNVKETQAVSGKDLRKQRSQQIREQSEIIYDGDLGMLVIPKTQEASCYWGKGTRWCTAADNNNMFKMYSADGPLYIWIDSEGDRYQFHFASEQFMDVTDTPIPPALLKKFREEHPVLKQMFAKEEKQMMMNPFIDIDMKMDYAYYTADSRVPSLEEFLVNSRRLHSLVSYVSYFSTGLADGLDLLRSIKHLFSIPEDYTDTVKKFKQSWENANDPR